MKNFYFKSTIDNLQYLTLIIVLLLTNVFTANAQVKKAFTQRTSQYTPTKKIYNVKGDFTMLGNTCLTPQNYSATTNNNGQFMTYVDVDGDPNTFNSSSSTLVLSTENGAVPSCSNIIYAGLYWTGKSSSSNTFSVTKQVAGSQTVNNDLNVKHNQTVTNTNYKLTVSNEGGKNDKSPTYTFSTTGKTYVFHFYNSSVTNRVTLSVNGGSASNIPVIINAAGTEATLSTPYTITDGTLTITIKKLIRNAATNLNATDTQNSSSTDVNVSGTLTTTTLTKTFDKRTVSLKGPGASSYTQITAAASDIYYPSGTDDDIFSGYAEITDYVKNSGIGQYTVADIALLEGDPGGTGYSGGWGIIVVYENSKMKWRDITIFDGYAYVESSNSSGFDLPVSGFNTVQSGNVGVKLGVMASEGDVSYTGDYFRIRNLNTANYTDLSHSGNSTTNFFNSSINAGGARNPNLVNNTGIDIAMFSVTNTNNGIIGNNQTSTNFKYGTNGDTYSIFTIAMAVDAYIPEPVGIIATTTINNAPAVQPYTVQPGQDVAFNLDLKNLGTEAVNNFKLVIPIPFNATYVAGSAVGTVLFTPLPTPNSVTFNPSLGATGSIVWDFGTLPVSADPNAVLAKLSFKLKATTDCTILSNATCGNSIVVNGNLSGMGGITGVPLNNSKLIQGYTQNGTCVGQPITDPIAIAIDGNNYVQQNCSNISSTRNFSYCSTDTSVGTTAIASNFPAGSLFYNEFPITVNSIQYSDANPIPLVAGSTVTYYAVPPNTIAGCNFPFTISKCPKIIAQDDTINGGNGGSGNVNAGNVLSNNGNGPDTINGNPATISQVVLTVTTPATSIGGNPVPSINPATGQISVPAGTPGGTYNIVYQICELNNASNCDPATVTITVTQSLLVATTDSFTTECGASGAIGNILSNDLLNNGSVSINDVILTITNSNPNLSIDQNGNISQNGPGNCGNYSFTYKICEKLNPTNCVTGNVAVAINDSTPPAISCPATVMATANSGCTSTGVALGTPITADNCKVASVSNDAPAVFPIGNTLVKWTVTDACGNTASCTQTVTVIDDQKPVVTSCAAPVNVNADMGSCTASNVSLGTPIATDNCGSGQVTITNNAPSAFPIGTTTVTWIIKDAANNTTTCLQTVTVTDNQKPIITTCAAPVNVNADMGACTASNVSLGAPSVTDNCNMAQVTITNNAPSTFPIGTTTVIWTIKDASGNTVTCSQTVTVTDNQKPIVTACSAPVNVTADTGACTASNVALGTPTVTDNCSMSQVSITNNAPSTFPIGTTTVIWTIKDAAGNTTTCNQTITVTDNQKPVVTTCAAPVNVTADMGTCTASNVSLGTPTVTDNCSISQLIITNNAPGTFPIGATTVTWTIKDAGNNTTTCTQIVTVTDNQKPIITTCAAPVNISADNGVCTATNVNLGTPTVTDNCSMTQVTVTNDAPLTFPVGTTTVTWTIKDAANNTTTCTQTVTVTDNQKPIIPVLPDVIGQCSATVPLATATDNCGGTITGTTPDPLVYNDQGTFTVHWTFNDGKGNIAIADQKVIVDNTTAPTAPVLVDVIQQCSATVPVPTVVNTCYHTTIYGTTPDPLSYTAQGTYTVHWTFDDGNGNILTTNQKVIVADTQKPTITYCAPAVNVNADSGLCTASNVTLGAPTVSDNCAVNPLTITNDAPTLFPTGTTTVTWTIKDIAGNIANCTQTVTVTDNQIPTVTACAAPVNVTADKDSCTATNVNLGAPTASDNCTLNPLTVTNDAPTAFPIGTTTVTWTIKDTAGNTVNCTQLVTVTDKQTPTVTACAAPVNVAADKDACSATNVKLGAPTASDNCTLNPVTMTNDAPAVFPIGTTAVTWTIKDAANNTVTCSQTVTVTDDQKPIVPASALADVIGQCSATVTPPTAPDNCAGMITATTEDPLIYKEQGTYIVHWTFNDGNGNIATANQNVIVDNTIPPAAPVLADVTGECSATASIPTVVNNCYQNAINGTTTDPLTYDKQGTYVIHWSFDDGNGNITTANQNVIIHDTTVPVLTANIAPADVTVECSAIPAASTADFTATDNCDANPIVTFSEDKQDGNCPGSYTLIRTWTATDASGNFSSISQKVTVQDTTPPVFTSVIPKEISASCDNIPIAETMTATDSCGTATVSLLETKADGSCLGNYTLTRTWTATDACGNTASFVQTINVSDTVPPTVEGTFQNIVTVSCDQIPTIPQLKFSDNCSGVGQITAPSADDNIINKTEDSYTIIRTWKVSDLCGNESTFIQTINVMIKDALSTLSLDACNADETTYNLNTLIPMDYVGKGTWADLSASGGLKGDNDGIFSPFGILAGNYTLEYDVNDPVCPRKIQINALVNNDCKVLPCGTITVHNFFSPNGDGYNDVFTIENINDFTCFPTNRVRIYNRWGALLFETEGYDNNEKAFRGISQAGATINQAAELPSGTYFYVLEYTSDSKKDYKESGYLYLSR